MLNTINNSMFYILNYLKYNFSKNNLPFCEKIYSFNPYIPQMASALAHFPYMALILYSISFFTPSIIKIKEKGMKNFFIIQIILQLITMIGHLIPNPRLFIIQEISIILTLSWLYHFLKLTTTSKNIPSKNTVIKCISVLIVSMYLIGLQNSINISITIIALSLICGYNIMDKLTKKAFYMVISILFLSFTILALENIYCESLLSIMPNFPWHFVFDIIFWQVFGSLLPLLVLSTDRYLVKID